MITTRAPDGANKAEDDGDVGADRGAFRPWDGGVGADSGATGWVRQGKGGRCGIPGGRWRNDGELSAPPRTPPIARNHTLHRIQQQVNRK